MRTQDQDIARKLLSLRHEMHALKLQWSCDDHQDMLDEAQCDLQEMHELQDICDTPLDSVQPHPLKQIGVTKMNLNARRFSILWFCSTSETFPEVSAAFSSIVVILSQFER